MINSIDELNDFYDSLDYEFSEDFEIEDSEIEDSDIESFEYSEDSEIDDSEDSETSEKDVSGNNSITPSQSSGESNFQPNYNIHDDFLNSYESEILDFNSYDYTTAFEDIKTVGIFLIALLLGLFIGLAFIKGFSSKNES